MGGQGWEGKKRRERDGDWKGELKEKVGGGDG